MKKKPYNYSSKDRSKKNVKSKSTSIGKSYNYYGNKSSNEDKNKNQNNDGFNGSLKSYGSRNYSNIGNRSYKYNRLYDNAKSYNNDSVIPFSDRAIGSINRESKDIGNVVADNTKNTELDFFDKANEEVSVVEDNDVSIDESNDYDSDNNEDVSVDNTDDVDSSDEFGFNDEISDININEDSTETDEFGFGDVIPDINIDTENDEFGFGDEIPDINIDEESTETDEFGFGDEEPDINIDEESTETDEFGFGDEEPDINIDEESTETDEFGFDDEKSDMSIDEEVTETDEFGFDDEDSEINISEVISKSEEANFDEYDLETNVSEDTNEDDNMFDEYNSSSIEEEKRASDNYNLNDTHNYDARHSFNDRRTTLIENTNTIKLDDSRLNDTSSLDTSFLEGRIERKVIKNKRVKERILKDNSDLLKRVELIRKIFTYVAIGLTLLLIVVFVTNNYGDNIKKFFASNTNKTEEKESTPKKQSDVIDRNYLFVGDHHSENIDFDEFDLDYHYVKSGKEDLTADEIYRNIKKMVYAYNPSIVFIEVGFHDIEYGHGDESYISYLTRVINGIKSNRPSALIYVQSIYPIDEDSDDVEFTHASNKRIVGLNEKIKNLSKELNVEYLDVYDMLCDDDKLNSDYTDDGMNLNKEGYKQVIKVIKKVIG